MSLSYRPEIDGLRAVAVGAVVLYHAGLPGISGGYAGVDVFFVLSGYLIGAILMGDLARDRFSLVRFYERRARRLLPALAVVVATTTLLAAALMRPGAFEDYAESVFATAVFAANVYFLRKDDYFGPAAEEMPLLHMWSLAVEEQFYILFPLVLWALWRWRRGAILPAMAVVALLSLGLAELGTRRFPQANFYLPTGRAWELLAGAMVAWHLRDRPRHPRPRLAWAGLALIAVALVLIDTGRPWPGLWAVPVVAGTVLVILCADPARGAGRLLASGPMVGLGLISYSVYLWHWPLMAFARITSPAAPPLAVMLGLAALSVVLGWASWRHVEQPFRHGHAPGRALAGAAVLLVALAGSGLLLRGAGDGIAALKYAAMPQASRDRLAEIAQPGQADMPDLPACKFNAPDVTPDFVERFAACRDRFGPAVLILGGSHGIDLFNAVAHASDASFVVGLTQGYCRPHRHVIPARERPCQYRNALDFAAAHPEDISLALYTQAPFTVFDANRGLRGTDGFRPELLDEVVAYLSALADHVPVLVLGPKPMSNVDVRRLSPWRDLQQQIVEGHDPGVDRGVALMDRVFAEKAAGTGLPFLSMRDILRDTPFPEGMLQDGRLTYSDQDHWSPFGEWLFGQKVLDALAARGYDDLLPSSEDRAPAVSMRFDIPVAEQVRIGRDDGY